MSGAMIAPDPAHRGGHALIRIPGGAGPGLSDPRFRLSREGYDAGTLGPAGWQVADALLTPLAAEAEGEDLILRVGPTVVDRVESGVVMLAVPALGFDAPVFWPEIPLSRGGKASAGVALPLIAESAPPIEARQKVAAAAPAPGRAAEAALAVPTATSQATAPPIVPQPPTAAAAQGGNHPGTARPRRLLPLAAVAVLVAAALVGGAWWAMRRSAQGSAPATMQAPSAQATAAAPSAASPAARPQAAVGPRDCTHGSVADAVACAADPDALAATAQRRWDAGQADQGLVLLQIAADRGSGTAALRLAQLYDPDTFRPGGPIPQPNAREAAQYYRRAVLAHQDAATAPRAALHQRLQTAAADGDPLAGLTLKDFWP
jgi:hypothetical protein